MKIKTSITLSEDVLKAVDKHSPRFKNRSVLIEAALRFYLASLARQEQDARDLSILNKEAERLNKEALEALGYQVPL